MKGTATKKNTMIYEGKKVTTKVFSGKVFRFENATFSEEGARRIIANLKERGHFVRRSYSEANGKRAILIWIR